MERGLACGKGRGKNEAADLRLVDTCVAFGGAAGGCQGLLSGLGNFQGEVRDSAVASCSQGPHPHSPAQGRGEARPQGPSAPPPQPVCFLGRPEGSSPTLATTQAQGPPSCVVRLVGLPWRGEARPAPTHGNFSQGVSHSGTQLLHRPGQGGHPYPLDPSPSCSPASYLSGVSGPSLELRKLMGVTSGLELRRSPPGAGLPARGLGVGDTLCGEKVPVLGWGGRWAAGREDKVVCEVGNHRDESAACLPSHRRH